MGLFLSAPLEMSVVLQLSLGRILKLDGHFACVLEWGGGVLNQAVEYPHRRFQILLRSTMGPIDVYLVRSVLLSCCFSSLIFGGHLSLFICCKNPCQWESTTMVDPFDVVSDHCKVLGVNGVAVDLKESLRR